MYADGQIKCRSSMGCPANTPIPGCQNAGSTACTRRSRVAWCQYYIRLIVEWLGFYLHQILPGIDPQPRGGAKKYHHSTSLYIPTRNCIQTRCNGLPRWDTLPLVHLSGRRLGYDTRMPRSQRKLRRGSTTSSCQVEIKLFFISTHTSAV